MSRTTPPESKICIADVLTSVRINFWGSSQCAVEIRIRQCDVRILNNVWRCIASDRKACRCGRVREEGQPVLDLTTDRVRATNTRAFTVNGMCIPQSQQTDRLTTILRRVCAPVQNPAVCTCTGAVTRINPLEGLRKRRNPPQPMDKSS